MGIPYHDNPIYDFDDFDVGLSDEIARDKLDTVIDTVNPNGNTVELSELIGSRTLEDGGVYGDILRLSRLHINDAKDKNELTSEVAGEVYARMMDISLNGALSFLFQRTESSRLDRANSVKLINDFY